MKTPYLETERLILRPLKVEDAEEVFSSWCSDADVAKYMRWTTHKNIEETKDWLALEEQNLCGNNFNWGFVLKSTGNLIGSGGVIINDTKKCYELGYNLMKSEWKKGFATEASKKIIEFVKNELNECEIYCCHAMDNIGSQKVIEKLGFKYTGISSYQKFDGIEFASKEYLIKLL